jgi:hypothetical protein
MPRIDFDHLPDDARLWVFAASEALEPAAAESLLTRVDDFLDGWNAHGHPLTGGRAWLDGRFLFVAVDERTAPPSGCSIDALHRSLKAYEDETGVGLTDHADVLYRAEGGDVARATRLEFARMAREGAVSLETAVFDTTLTRKAELDARFEVPAGEAWHRRAFWRGAPVG